MTQPEPPPDHAWVEFDNPYPDWLLWTITAAMFGMVACVVIVAILTC